MRVTIPHNYKPRPYQLPLLEAIDSGINRAVAVWHRRAGKDKTLVNLIVKKALERKGAYYYFFPTYAQGKKILWDGMDRDGFPFRSHIPKEIVKSEHSTELKVVLKNGSIIQIIGSDNIDSVVGTNPVGCIFSEYALQNPKGWDFVRPILAENEGWAVFNYTPRGKNHGYDLYVMAQRNPDWFCQVLTVDDTKAISKEFIHAEREAGMSDDLIEQEFYCSFDAAIQGAYYSKQINQARKDKRICNIPYDQLLKVNTVWDLGIGDATSIWFYQQTGLEIRLIDYYEASGEGLSHYKQVLNDRGYVYGEHYAPHDIQVRELGTGRSRLEVAETLGINFEVVPNLPIDDGIEAARSIFSRCWFDEEKCQQGVDALASYHKDYDDKRREYKIKPVHDWSSHAADAFRYLAIVAQNKLHTPRQAGKLYQPASWASL